MRVGLFTDSYYPQISGVATSIQTLALELEKLGHEIFIFTTTDPRANVDHERNIIRLQSIPFVSLAERKIVLKGVFAAYLIAKDFDLDIIHRPSLAWGYLVRWLLHSYEYLSFTPFTQNTKITSITLQKDG